ncbi:uncharacterized protein IL334_001305 [Kwoniella shivajii]|uniref:DUF1740-domain-containing protein n=1 Tax=Kwoniella shivajii TaxID=564305 RepID=A0ABZ1CRI8_9TREE|nr:hypothetical protein IL334_001305 [Kwoniella shivajii]
MSSAPTFYSFPDLPSKSEAGPSKLATPPVPSFGSFPELEKPKKVRRRSRSYSDSDDGKRSKRTERESDNRRRSDKNREDDRRGERDKSGRRRGVKEKDDGRETRRDQNRHRSRSRETDSNQHRHRDRSKDRQKERTRDRSAERRYKEDRRKRERDQAQALIRGESKSLDIVSKKHKEEKWSNGEDGTPWYESMGKVQVEQVDSIQAPSREFFPDTTGDRDIVRYGNTSSTSVPRYYRDGKNRILGLNEGLRIVYSRERTQKGLEIAPMGRPYIPRYNSRQTESTASMHLRRILLLPSDTQAPFNPHLDYLDFELRPTRREEDIPSYRSITHPHEEDDDEMESIKAAIGSYSTLEEEVRKETIQTEHYLRSHPDDIDKWVSYSQLHLRTSPESETSIHSADPGRLQTTRAKAEVTLSILSRALDAEEDNFTSTKLHLAYLKAAEQFWPNEKVTNRWKNVLRELGEKGKDEEGMMEVWLGYIAWREGQGFGSGAGVDEVVEVYEECIGRLKDSRGSGDLQAKEENLVYLFLRACIFLKQAGYSERALASFQALIEITFFKTDHLRVSSNGPTNLTWFAAVLDQFEQFWDTECPRVGEVGSKGWRHTSPSPISLPAREAKPLQHESEDPFEMWLEAEKHADSTYSLPGRATDLNEDIEDDPYHTVLFSDIRSLLFPVTSPEVRLQLIYAFLTFLGLPFTPPNVPSSSPASNDPHLNWTLTHNEGARNAFWPLRQGVKRMPWQTVGGEPMDPERTRGLDNPFQGPVKCWLQDRGSMLGRKGSWFRDLDPVDIGSLDIDFIRSVFGILRPLVPDPAFTLASFAFESAVSPKGAVKLAKSILASDRDNLLLWDGYARLERQRGNMSAARTVYVTALQAAITVRSDDSASEDELDLWAGCAEMEFENGEEARALEVIVLAAGIGQDRLADYARSERPPISPSPIAMLKAKQYYSNQSRRLSTSQVLLKSIFVYLTDGIEVVQSFLLNQLTDQPPSSGEAEEILQLLAKLLHLHSTRHASPASLSRDTLELALSAFPSNTSFLSLYLYGELGGRVYGRVQRLIAEITCGKERFGGLVTHLWSIWAEGVSSHRTFWDEGGGGAERVRLALDRAINSATGRYSAAIWMLYVEFETLMRKYQTAKQLCYRAVASLGGCKPLYLLPFSSTLRQHFTPRELKDWSELMIERGIRIRIPFENYFDTMGEEGALMKLPEDEDLQEDELDFLTQREVAKPY